MAGAEHLIKVPENEDPWPLVFEIADATREGSWVLVGGLMVHAHAIRAGVEPSRPTSDVDLLLDIGASRVSDVAGPLQSLGFAPLHGGATAPLHRFTRGEDVVDVMVEPGISARWSTRSVFVAPAARQAIDRRDWYVLQGATKSARIAVPDPLGAIVAKAAAYHVDQRDRGRHLEDLTVLMASAGGRRALDLERLTRRDKQHLRPALGVLTDDGHDAWGILETGDRAVAQRARRAIAEAVDPPPTPRRHNA